MTTYIIPCGDAKLDHLAPARDLYTGTMFRHTLRNVEAMAASDRPRAQVLILSARYGLITLDTVLAPYTTRITDHDAISVAALTTQAIAFGLDGADVYCLLPRAYFRRIDTALRELDTYPADVYEAVRGIGDQRRVNCNTQLPATTATTEEPTQCQTSA